jgi:hypothetical protein
MPEYIYNNDIFSEEDVLLAAENKGLTLEEYLEQNKDTIKVQDPTAVQDRTVQPNVVIPEIDPNAPLSSGNFYSILKDDEEEEKVEEKVEAKQTDFRLLIEEEE